MSTKDNDLETYEREEEQKIDFLEIVSKYKIMISTILFLIICFLFFLAGAKFSCNKGEGYLYNWACVDIKEIDACQYKDKYYVGDVELNNNISQALQDNNTEGYEIIDLYINFDGHKIEYVDNYYDCVNFTRALLNFSVQNDFYCEQVVGCTGKENNTCHSWVRCDIEPQTLKLVNYNNKYPEEYD